MEHHDNTPQIEVQPADKAKIWGIWKVMLILLAVTAVEFVIAFTMESGAIKTFIFVILTIVKAFYIVGQFMHLSHEKKSLIWAILLPTMFIVFLLFILSYQGSAIFSLLY
ncbi:cytochrome C oxidase subunit IV family protein [Marinoscillum sp. MHG1-6]|uniref:cytochrome C oxidase subunit IV family protein n=1 Tax=Marinoscillum sp. MHG1-6 TaxID=2959627 RepID=UPI002158370B|nr:cytochrome C oxidase subunit IV family protein [Marinoscillum sp. MHG1-6]